MYWRESRCPNSKSRSSRKLPRSCGPRLMSIKCWRPSRPRRPISERQLLQSPWRKRRRRAKSPSASSGKSSVIASNTWWRSRPSNRSSATNRRTSYRQPFPPSWRPPNRSTQPAKRKPPPGRVFSKPRRICNIARRKSRPQRHIRKSHRCCSITRPFDRLTPASLPSGISFQAISFARQIPAAIACLCWLLNGPI